MGSGAQRDIEDVNSSR